jgi:hypothetical protein
VPPRGLPGNANLEQLKNGAKSFQRAVRSGDASWGEYCDRKEAERYLTALE